MDDWLTRFVNQENITRLSSGFGRETDPKRRQVIKELLLAEEYLHGARSWHLELIERLIAQTDSHIERQQEIIAGGRGDEPESKHAELLLANYSESRRLFEEFRRSVVQELGRGTI